ncbi:efflux RND transporter periplasmic adaptor subunit [Sunxiuqinia elliptica]|uniref:HlyD family secretion protein n=1 Tax=Sunxiuqinia elliptica TaxID=655355 RepID=A0A1I2CQ05_9BACT|nr:efflux RND transporter periplasmic adaptor subunit [Sunxiuqinia elliptica]SFE70328.1 HlyD family secretion protein [Sunxiuqinia elliptica]
MAKKKKNKLLPFALAFLVVLIIVLVVGKKKGWFGKDFEVKVTTQKVVSKTITELITANGKVQPETEVKISPDVSGEIIVLEVEEGDEVEKGQLLVVIKPDIYIQALNRAEASLNSSKARLAQTEAQMIERELAFKRTQTLYKQEAVPESEFESAQAAYQVAEAEVRAAGFSVKSAEASVAEAQEQLVKTKIYAPMNGTISRLNVEQGERVVGTNMYAGTEMMVIANLNKMEVKVEVNENDIVKVSKGDTALVEVDAYLKRKFKGIVTEIANSANTLGTSSDQVTNFDVKVLLLQESYRDLMDSASMSYPFRPGMSATVDIQTETREGVIAVPIQAVTTRVAESGEEQAGADDKEKEEVIFVMKDGLAWKQVVETGIQDNQNIEILSGITDGDEIITGPYNVVSRTLKDSLQVKAVDEKELFKAEK